MSIQLDQYVRRSVLRKLVNPTIVIGSTADELPLGSINHYLNTNSTLTGPQPHEFPSLIDDRIYMYHLHELPKDLILGRRHESRLYAELNKQYHRKYSGFSKVFKLDRILEKDRVPLIINYNMLPHLYIVRNKNLDTNLNIFKANWDLQLKTINELDTGRPQFLTIHLPAVIGDDSEYRDLAIRPTQAKLRKITTQAGYGLQMLFNIFYGEDGFQFNKDRNVFIVIEDRSNQIIINPTQVEELIEEVKNPTLRLTHLTKLLDALIDLRVDVINDVDMVVVDDTAVKVNVEGVVKETSELVNDPTKLLKVHADKLLELGTITTKEHAANIALSQRYKTIPSLNGKGTIADVLKESKESSRDLPSSTMTDIKMVPDKSLINNSISNMTKEYLTKHLEPELIEHVMELQNHGISVLGITKSDYADAAGETVTYSVEVKPIKGSKSTIKITMPKFKDNGDFKSGGVNYRLNSQRVSLPIVKVGPKEVTLTSSMSKMFVRVGRSANANFDNWLLNKLFDMRADGKLDDVDVGNTGDSSLDKQVPLLESILRSRFKKFKYNTFTFNVDAKVGLGTLNGKPFIIGKDSKLYSAGEDQTYLGEFMEVMDIPTKSVPAAYSEIYIKGKHVPISVLIAHWIGFTAFIKYIGCGYTLVERNTRVKDESLHVIRLQDSKILIEWETEKQKLLLNGFNYFKTALNEVSMHDLDSPRGYLRLFASRGINKSHEIVYDLIHNGWVDPVTRRILVEAKQPTNIIDILLYANELLTHRQHATETDGRFMYSRGYSRVNDLVFRELMEGVRELNRNPTGNRKLSINPRATELAILKCPAVVPVEMANPLNQISSETRVVYSGVGGRNNRSMVGRHRVFDKHDLGVISEAGTDDGKAGTVLNYPLAPNLKNLYGMPITDGELSFGSVFSPSTLVSPYSMHDDMKRTIFSRIQGNSWISSDFRASLPIRTSAELVIAHHVAGTYSLPTTQAGHVSKVTPRMVEITYEDKSKVVMGLGDQTGGISGKTILRHIVTDRKKGYKFKAGEIIAWDELFFGRDWIEDTQVAMYTGTPLYVAMRENESTYEDGASSSIRAAEKMANMTVHTKSIAVEFTSEFRLKVAIGDHLTARDVIANIAPEGVPLNIDESSLEYLSQDSPVAGDVGDVFKIEVFYCGDPKDATSGIRKVIKESDASFKERSEFEDVHPNGYIRNPTFVGQQMLKENTAVIIIYTKHLDIVKVGDKSSLCNQLKFVTGNVFTGTYETMQGLPIDADFSQMGILSRIVTSPKAMGVGNYMQDLAGKAACKAYRLKGSGSAFIKVVTDHYDKLAKLTKSYYDLGPLIKLITAKLKSMNGQELLSIVERLEKGSIYLPLVIPHQTGTRAPLDKWLKMIDDLGGETFTHLKREDPITGAVYVTPETYWVGLFPARRQIQTIAGKKSMPKDNRTIDTTTGQVTGASKGSSLSSVQAISILSRSMKANALELAKVRGGDNVAAAQLNKAIVETGGASLEPLLNTDTRPESTTTLGTHLNAAHLHHNL